MYWKDAIRVIDQRIDCRRFLRQSKGGLYVCPFCGSGENGNENTGALKYYPETNTWTCFACRSRDDGKGEAKFSGDVIDLYIKENGVSTRDAVVELAQQAGINDAIEFGQHRSTAAEDFSDMEERKTSPLNGNVSGQLGVDPEENPADFTNYYAYCMSNLQESLEAKMYLRRRGISIETAMACCLGFDPEADPANAPGAMGNERRPFPSPRIIIPTSISHYVGRSIDPSAQIAKLNNKGGKPGIFQERLLYCDDNPVFVCEGAFDALSILELNQHAIALNSAANVDLLLNRLKEKPTKSTLILCLDKDSSGKAAAQKLADGLRQLNISYIVSDISGAHKDPNEALTADREAFQSAITGAISQLRPDNTAAYLDNVMAGEIERFKQAQNRLTGFPNLDEKAGGLNAGLYVLAAISSLGKTTLALQMADQIAASGQEVLFFSMEMSRLELVSKSLARITAQNDMKTAVTSLSIRKGNLSPEVMAAARQYKEKIGERVSIIEGGLNCDIGFIANYARTYKQRTGITPIIFIDYLQILQPSAEGKSKASKKDEIDLAVTELKRLSRELDATIIVISSLNRTNYTTPVAFESLKESGGIEYTADVIWGLQLACIDEDIFDKEGGIKAKRKRINDAKIEDPRQIKFVCLKNRYGISNFDCQFSYYPAYDLFIPAQNASVIAFQRKRNKPI